MQYCFFTTSSHWVINIPRFAYKLRVLSFKLVPCTILISSAMDRAVFLSFLSFVLYSRHRCVAVINAPSTRFFKLRFSALWCYKRRLVLGLIVSLGMVLVVYMSTDDPFVIAVLGIIKFTTWDGGSPTIAVSLEPIVKIGGDKFDPSLTTIWYKCNVTI